MIDKKKAEEILKAHGQEHVLKFYDSLSGDEKEKLLAQIEDIDWDSLSASAILSEKSRGKLEPMGAHTVSDIEAKRSLFEEKGWEALKEGKCAALLLAGGMGTRLGMDAPKGELNVGITEPHYLFQCHIEAVLDISKKAGKTVPFFIMTSEKNDEETRRFFREHEYFGYPENDIFFFKQSMACATDFSGKLLMEEKGRIATSPNGNGGWYSSIKKAGLSAEIKRRGVEWLNVFSVDNPLQKICDPAFIGAAILSGKDSASKVIRKNDPEEKLGVLCTDDGVPSIVEYYEMTDEMKTLKDSEGELLYAYGVILNYLFKVEALERISGKTLPVHSVEKKIPCIDEDGNPFVCIEPNGFKYETLILDMISLVGDTLAYEVVREKEFAPIKNLHGIDSLDSARDLMKADGIRL